MIGVPTRRTRTLSCGAALLALLVTGGCWSDNGAVGSVQATSGRTAEADAGLVTGPDVRYVSPDGRDDGRGTESAPWRTLAHALERVYAGQVLYVRGGDYREDLRSIVLHEGRPDDRILVQAYPGERPVVHGLVWLRQPSYWTIDGLNVTWDASILNPSPHMVKVTGGVGWTWQNGEIWGAVGVANVLIDGGENDEPADWSFTGNCVHDLALAPGVNRGSNMTIGDMVAAGPGTIERNVLFGVETGRNLTFGYQRAGDSGGPTDILVRYNTLYDSSSALRLAGDTSGVRIERNIFAGVRSRILIRAGTLQGGGVKVQQNLGVGLRQFFLEGHTGELSPNRFGNNLVDAVDFDDVTSCAGFTSTDSVTLPYGSDAIG